MTNPSLVRMYTEYYHQYMAWHQTYAAPTEQSHVAAWAKYHADCASRAAHYFHAHPTVTTAPPDLALPPPPPPLPPSTTTISATTTTTTKPHKVDTATIGNHPTFPANPSFSSSTSVVAAVSQPKQNPFAAAAWQQQPVHQSAVAVAAVGKSLPCSSSTPPVANPHEKVQDGLKRYVDRCLQRQQQGTTAPNDKAAVLKLVETMIKEELRKGTFHTIHWDTKPLLVLPHHPQQQQHGPQVAAVAAAATPAAATPATMSLATVVVTGQTKQKKNAHHRDVERSNTATRAIAVSYSTGSGGSMGATKHPPPPPPPLQWGNVSDGHSSRPAAANVAPGKSGSTVSFKVGHHQPNQYNAIAKQGYSKKKSSSFASYDSYYGPSETNTFHHQQQFDDDDNNDDAAEFISVPSYHKSIVNKKSKRKHAEVSVGFNQTNDVLTHRARRFSGPGGVRNAATMANGTTTSGDWDRYMGKTTIGGSNKKLDESDYEHMTIRGTCQTLEKAYLRLTAPPRAELVRPQPILAQHLQHLKDERKKKKNKNGQCRDYLWFCSQLKAVRQDCTVQRIQNAFAVDVYETHAKMALEENDLNEYNQCQTQLKELYALLAERKEDELALRHCNEFFSYRLVYYVFLAMENQKYDGGSSDMFKIMLSLTHQQHADPMIQQALAVREACCSGILDYRAFFRLRSECTTTSSTGASHLIFLLNHIVPSMRHQALLRICKGYRPSTLAVDFVLHQLGFETEDLEFGQLWLQSCGCVLSENGQELLTKETVVHESVMAEKQSLI